MIGTYLIPVLVTFLVWTAIFTTGMSALSWPKRLIAIALVAIALQVPMFGTTPFYYLRGVFGDFSATHALWALAALGNRVTARDVFVIPQHQKITVALILVAVAVCFYPSALGAVDFDMYRLGFAPASMLIVLAILALLAWQTRQYFLLASIVTAVLAFRFEVLESNNLWDYLFDPLLIVYCAVWLVVTLLRFVFRRVMEPPVQTSRFDAAAVQS